MHAGTILKSWPRESRVCERHARGESHSGVLCIWLQGSWKARNSKSALQKESYI